jgi:S1-C subfamily serine protease
VNVEKIVCPSCKSTLQSKGEYPAGKKVRCPRCSVVFEVPALDQIDHLLEVVEEGSPPLGGVLTPTAYPPIADVVAQPVYPPMQPMHGLHPAQPLAGPPAVPYGPGVWNQPPAVPPPARRDLTGAEYFVAIVLAPIGVLIGLAWLLMRRPAGGRMLLVSSLMVVITGAGGAIYHYFTDEPDDVTITKANLDQYGGANNPPPVIIDPDDFTVPDPGPPVGGAPDMSIDLDSAPDEIRRALRANVKVETDQRALGSGVIVQREGDVALVLTNRHVIDREFTDRNKSPEIPDLGALSYPRVTYFTKESNPGKVVWIAPDAIDLAIVETKCPTEIEPIEWYAAEKVSVSDEVFAVGNPIGLSWTYTKGVVSQNLTQKFGERDVSIIQTDTPISPGNSGGGLYTKGGKLIGINTAIINPLVASRIGFSIRVSVLAELKPEMLKQKPGGGAEVEGQL